MSWVSELSAHEVVRMRLCKRPGCDGEAEDATGRFAGLCHGCKQDAIAAAREAGFFSGGGRARAGTLQASPRDGQLVETARELARQARRVERAQKQLDRERDALRTVYLRFGVETGFLGTR